MKLQQLFTDDDAVSPVIGVILMVAITVILAAVIGAFVLGIGGDQAQTPQATFQASEDTNNNGNVTNVTLTHQSGDSIEATNLAVSVPGQDTVDITNDTSVTAGSEIEVDLEGGTWTGAGDDLLLIWSPEGSTDTSTINTHTFTSTYETGSSPSVSA